MSEIDDRMNCIRNLMQMMCCDKKIAPKEKKFLKNAAKQLEVQVDNWDELLKEVLQDMTEIYTIEDPVKAIATLKAMVVMAKADKVIDENEKQYLVCFAKSIGVSSAQWNELLKNIDLATLFDSFKKPVGGKIIAIKEHFDRIDDFRNMAVEHNHDVQVVTFDQFRELDSTGALVCFHAAPDRERTVENCKGLLNKSDKLVSILDRSQGYQVRYLLEQGLKKCIIEPVYTNDMARIFDL